jgi:predicted O-methyltransferase YrrM
VGAVPDGPRAEIVPGWFDEVLPGFLESHPGPVDVLHLDADLYSSTAGVLQQVGPRLRPGSVVVFDEFFNYPGWQGHEHRAWMEFVERENVGFRYEVFTHDNEQVVVVITSVEPSALVP